MVVFKKTYNPEHRSTKGYYTLRVNGISRRRVLPLSLFRSILPKIHLIVFSAFINAPLRLQPFCYIYAGQDPPPPPLCRPVITVLKNTLGDTQKNLCVVWFFFEHTLYNNICIIYYTHTFFSIFVRYSSGRTGHCLFKNKWRILAWP